MIRASIVAALLAGCTPAWALNVPTAGGEDPHIRVTSYSPYQRVRITLDMDHTTTITYAPTERVIRLTNGDDKTVQGPDASKLSSAPLRNNLPLWPLKAGATNMQVTTALPDGSERLYQYDIVVQAPPSTSESPDAIYGLIYTYPRDVRAAKVEEFKERRAIQQKQQTEDRLATDFFYGDRNWRYVAQGKDRWMAPDQVSDNGRLTAFQFAGNREVPAIYVVGRDGTEQVTPFTQQGALTLVQRTACHFRLRLGGGVLEIWNRGDCTGVGENPGTGTTSPDVVRELKAAQR
jgi:type IV secretion system protein VirB9